MDERTRNQFAGEFRKFLNFYFEFYESSIETKNIFNLEQTVNTFGSNIF